MASSASPHSVRHMVGAIHGDMYRGVSLAIDCLPRPPGQHLPGGPSHVCPIRSLGSVLVYVQWSCERVGTWSVVATRHVPVRSTAPIRPRCHSAGGVPRPRRDSLGGSRVHSRLRRAVLFYAHCDWGWTGTSLGRHRCAPLEPSRVGRPAKACAHSDWRSILAVGAGRQNAAGACCGASSLVDRGARQLHRGPC